MCVICLGCIFGLMLTLSLSPPGYAALCGTHYKCVCANSIMDCRQKGLPSFPQSIGSDIKAIYLDNNSITYLGQIPEKSDLQTVVLNNNRITSLEYDLFNNLDNLKILYLSNNSIEVIPNDVFEWNPLKLEVLYLDGNKLEFIEHFLFYDLEELTDLYLQNNDIVFIHPHAFLQLKNLRNLRLDGNKLHTFNHKWIDKLQANMFTELRFDNNPWSCDCAMNHSYTWLAKEKKSKWFHTLTSEHELTCKTPDVDGIRGTNLKTVNKTTAMSHCDMPKIVGISKPTTLQPTRSVKLRCVVDKTRYPVSTISWTAPNKDVYRLNTAINYDGIEVGIDGSLLITNLSTIDNGSYTCNASNYRGSHIATTTLIVAGKPPPTKASKHTASTTPFIIHGTETPDPKRTVVPEMFCPSDCQCISKHVDCSGDGSAENRLPQIPAKIPDDAVTISLAGNALKSLSLSNFTSFKDLEELRLDDNVISSIDSHAFNHVGKLTTLTLQQNDLADVKDSTFSRLHKLNVLVLDRNKLTKLRKKMFKGLVHLKWLYLRHNDIETISVDAFHYLMEIKFIHLESNKLLSLPQDPFSSTANLRSLSGFYVDNNNFQCNCKMERIRRLLQSKNFLRQPGFFGRGIICSSPPELFGVNLRDVMEKLECSQNKENIEIVRTVSGAIPNVYYGLLVVCVLGGIMLTCVILVLWKRYGKSARCNVQGHEVLI